jgi:N,N-dimethylformamidase
MRSTGDGDADRVPFFVAPPKGRATARLAVLLPTATYLAYANMPDPHDVVRRMTASATSGSLPRGELQTLLSVGDYGPSCYHVHTDGSGVHHSSSLRPVENMRPRGDLWAFNADMLIIDWLEESGIDYDVLTDELFHAEGRDLLERYRVVVTGTHPEYTSTRMLDALAGYLDGGGRLAYLGANGFYWRIAYSDAWPGAIELRRAEDGTRAWEAQPGEYHHAWGGELGGLWRRIGRPPNRLVGVGFAAQGFMTGSAYAKKAAAADPRAAFVFEGVESDVFGEHGRLGGAAGEEIDRFDPLLGSPAHALVLATANRFGPDMMKTKEEFLATVPPDPGDPDVRADVVFFETPHGGAVFSTGSIAWAGSLADHGYANDVSRITGNVIRRFLDPAPFEGPSADR